MSVSKTQKLNDKLDRIWEDLTKYSENLLTPLYFEDVKKRDIVFVGMNPSFNEGAIRKWFQSNEWSEEPRDYYQWRNRDAYSVERETFTRQHFLKNYPFFKQHHDLVQKLGSPSWCHLDLFPYRETKQKNLVELYETQPKFKNECLGVFDEALRASDPKMIIIWNAKASKIFFKKYSKNFDEKIGTFRLHSNSLKCPVFACSVVTGRRALDVFSRERMFWHVKKVYSDPKWVFGRN
ncbi:hypothetical protein [Litorimonas sp.]|uniref:hypothetical protein n=1 Tax=Litorimonas sp. TaxID=1892381 RepID=UPI003A8B9005